MEGISVARFDSLSMSSKATTVSNLVQILCCMCGQSMAANNSNMCSTCISSNVDLTEGIAKQVSIFYCKGCGRYLKPGWIQADLESPELLALCLKKIKGLNANGVKLIDAAFVWTEPHSRRIKVKVTIRREALQSVILEQSFVVEFIVQYQQCEDCTKLATEHGVWKSCVQVRQRVSHQRTFLFLEQLLIKHQMTRNILKVVSMPNGLDFFYTSRSHGNQLLDFLDSVAPVRSKQSKRLVSQDFSNNTVNYKYSVFVEIAPICRYDLVCLNKSTRKIFGNPPPLMIIHRVSNVVQLIDPISKNKNGPLVEIDASVYWKYEFKSICTINDLVDYIILDVEIDESCPRKGKFQMATMTIARKSDFGVNDKTFEVRSHLGNVLHPGDHASGYHIVTLNANSDELDETRATEPHNIPEIILVKKLYPSRKNRSKKRVFKLQELEKEDEEGEYGERKSSQKKREQEEAMEHDRELFLQEIEEDPEIRGLINLYARHEVTEDQQADDEGEEEDEEDGFPEIKLDELLDELKLQ